VQRRTRNVGKASPSAGEFPCPPIGEGSETHPFERQPDRRARLPAIEPRQRGGELEILPDGKEGVDRRLLKDEPQPVPGRPARPHDIVAKHRRVTAGRAQQGGQQEHRRGLARAIGAEQPHLLPGPHAQAEAVKRPRAPVVATEILGRDGCHAHAGCGSLENLR
jgi:hypothetical protein